jgi:hypothetical protein
VTERDDFLREHLSPPADSDDEPAGRPPEMPPSTPPPAGQDDTPPHNPVDDAPRPTGPDNDGSRVPDLAATGKGRHPRGQPSVNPMPRVVLRAGPGNPRRQSPPG